MFRYESSLNLNPFGEYKMSIAQALNNFFRLLAGPAQPVTADKDAASAEDCETGTWRSPVDSRRDWYTARRDTRSLRESAAKTPDFANTQVFNPLLD